MNVTGADRVELWIAAPDEAFPPPREPDLVLGDESTKSVVKARLVRERTHWRVDTAAHRTTTGAWVIVPRPHDTPGATATHPALWPELWHAETSSTSHRKRGKVRVAEALAGDVRADGWMRPGSVVGKNDEGSEDALPPHTWALAHDTAGQACIWLQDLPLVVGVWPRHFLDVAGKDEPPAEQVWDALKRLGRMVRDLREVERALEGAPDAQGIATPEGDGESGWRQRLQQIADLVDRQGVASAWAALVSDPVVRLAQEFPVRPLDRAVRPVLQGTRGPWTLADGWHPPRHDGRVRDRIVIRTVDTPPNRLAVQSAMRVVRHLDQIDADIAKDAAAPEATSGMLGAWQRLADRLRRQARRVLTAPSLAEVSRTEAVALDSPSVQTNARCQPLLRAWRRLNLNFAQASPFEAALRDPLGKTNEVYELWCWIQVNAALAKVVGLPAVDAGRASATAQTWQQEFTGRVRSIQSSKDTTAHTSWSLARAPDGIVATPAGFLVWDAKYRAWPPAQYGEPAGSPFVYQAHAFRDAVRLNDGPKTQALWSLVLFAGEGGHDRFFLSVADAKHGHHDDVSQQNLDPLRAAAGGVGVLRLRPPLDKGSDAHLATLEATLRTILTALGVTVLPERSAA